MIFHLNAFLVSGCTKGFKGKGNRTGMYAEIFVLTILQLFAI